MRSRPFRCWRQGPLTAPAANANAPTSYNIVPYVSGVTMSDQNSMPYVPRASEASAPIHEWEPDPWSDDRVTKRPSALMLSIPILATMLIIFGVTFFLSFTESQAIPAPCNAGTPSVLPVPVWLPSR